MFFFSKIVSVRKLRCHRDGELIVTEKSSQHMRPASRMCSGVRFRSVLKGKIVKALAGVGCAWPCEWGEFGCELLRGKSNLSQLKLFKEIRWTQLWTFEIVTSHFHGNFHPRKICEGKSPNRHKQKENIAKLFNTAAHRKFTSGVDCGAKRRRENIKHKAPRTQTLDERFNELEGYFISYLLFFQSAKAFRNCHLLMLLAARMCYWLKFALSLARSLRPFHNFENAAHVEASR